MAFTRRHVNTFLLSSAIGSTFSGQRVETDSTIWQSVQGDAAHTGYCQSTQSAIVKGDVLWEADIGGTRLGSPVVADGAAFAGSNEGRFVAVDLENGTQRWERRGTDEIIWAAAVDANAVYVNLNKGSIAALDVRTGTSLWQTELEARVNLNSAQVLADGTLYVCDNAGNVYAIDCTSGEIRWSANPDMTPTRGTIAVKNDQLYLATDFLMGALNREDGHSLWTAELGRQVWGAPTVDEHVYVPLGPRPSIIEAYSTESGEFQWSFRTSEDPTDTYTLSPIVTEESIIAIDGRGNIATAAKTDGSIQWRHTIDGRPQRAPVACQDTMYVPTEENVIAISIPSGEVQWRTHVGQTAMSPALVRDTLLVTAESGKLIALGEVENTLDKWGTKYRIAVAGVAGLGGYGAYRYYSSRTSMGQN